MVMIDKGLVEGKGVVYGLKVLGKGREDTGEGEGVGWTKI
jgi:hypothetical protein